MNVASRVTGLAEPGAVLATRSVREAAPEGFAWSAMGRERLRGVADEVELFSVRREAPRPGEDAG